VNVLNETSEQLIWVIKDNQNNFANERSIGKLTKYKWLYIVFKTFSPEARGYITRKQAEVALSNLNKRNIVPEFDIPFHLEHLSLDKIIAEHKSFQGDNLVIHEKELPFNYCRITRMRMCPCSRNLVFTGTI